MSGGVAYVYDPDGRSPENLNAEMVDLDALDDADVEWLHEMIAAHVDATDSAVGQRILADWEDEQKNFVKVMPRDYKRVLQAIARGRSPPARDVRRHGDHGGRAWLIPSGFLKHTQRETPQRRPVPLRLRDWKEVYEDFSHDTLRDQASRCMDCGIPFCHNGCPLGNLIPEWNDLVCSGRWRDAIERLHATNNFPEFTGRLCPAPCEASCVLGINQDPGDDQAGRGRDHRQRLRRGLGDAAAAGAAAPARRSPSSAPARPAWPPPSSSPAPATR